MSLEQLGRQMLAAASEGLAKTEEDETNSKKKVSDDVTSAEKEGAADDLTKIDDKKPEPVKEELVDGLEEGETVDDEPKVETAWERGIRAAKEVPDSAFHEHYDVHTLHLDVRTIIELLTYSFKNPDYTIRKKCTVKPMYEFMHPKISRSSPALKTRGLNQVVELQSCRSSHRCMLAKAFSQN
jgi:hypothetical protein